MGDSGRFKDKTDFPTMTRMAYCQCRLRRVFGSVFQQFNWTDISLIMDRDDDHALILGETLDVGLQKGGYLPYVYKYYGLSNPNFASILQDASKYSRGGCALFLSSLHGVGVSSHEVGVSTTRWACPPLGGRVLARGGRVLH